MGEIFTEILGGLWGVWKAMFSDLIAFLPRVFSFVMWVLLAVLVLPCVFVAYHIYPIWTDWGENL